MVILSDTNLTVPKVQPVQLCGLSEVNRACFRREKPQVVSVSSEAYDSTAFPVSKFNDKATVLHI